MKNTKNNTYRNFFWHCLAEHTEREKKKEFEERVEKKKMKT